MRPILRHRYTLLLLPFLLGPGLPLKADSPVEMFQSALDAYFNGRYDESAHFFEQILAIDPKNEKAKQGLKNSQRKRAEQIRRDREQERKALYVAQAYLSQGKLIEAFDRGREILARVPNLPDAEKLLKKVRKKAEKNQRKAKPESSAFYEAQGDLAYMDGDWFKAVDSWEKVLVFNQDRADLMQRLADVKKKLAERQREERIQVTMDLARANVQQGLFAEALKVLDDVLRLDPTNAEARIMLNDARRSAAQAYKSKMEGQVQEINQKAMDAFSVGRRKEALGLFNKALEIDPENRLALDYQERILGLDPALLDSQRGGRSGRGADFARATKLLEEENFVEAIEVLERYLVKAPNDLKGQQMLDEARLHQRELTERAYREGLTAYSRGDRGEAIRKLQDCRRLDPDFTRAKQALIKIMQEGNE
jgi:tetratricopeptide (TPR) repeat protein